MAQGVYARNFGPFNMAPARPGAHPWDGPFGPGYAPGAMQTGGFGIRDGVADNVKRVDGMLGGMSQESLQRALFGVSVAVPTSGPYDGQARPFRTTADDLHTAEQHVTTIFKGMVLESEMFAFRLMPLEFRSELGLEVNTTRIIFNAALPDETPVFGTSRELSQRKESHTTATTRLGIQFSMEHGFAMTPSGVKDYYCSLQQMKYSIERWLLFSVLYKLMDAPSQMDTMGRTVAWHAAMGVAGTVRTLEDAVAHQACLWGALNKTNGYAMMMARALRIFEMRKITPNTILLPNGATHALKLRTLATDDFSMTGASANSVITGGAPENRTDGGLHREEMPLLLTEEGDPPVDVTERERSYGEYFVVTDKHYGIYTVPANRPVPAYDALVADPNISILDYETDTMTKLSRSELVDALPIWDAVGQLNDHGKAWLGPYLDDQAAFDAKWTAGANAFEAALPGGNNIAPDARRRAEDTMNGFRATHPALMATLNVNDFIDADIERVIAVGRVLHADVQTVADTFERLAIAVEGFLALDREHRRYRDAANRDLEIDTGYVLRAVAKAVIDNDHAHVAHLAAAAAAGGAPAAHAPVSDARRTAVVESIRGGNVALVAANLAVMVNHMGALAQLLGDAAARGVVGLADFQRALLDIEALHVPVAAWFTRAHLHALIARNQRLPVNLLLFRPNVTWLMKSAIVVEGGPTLGKCLLAAPDFMLATDVNSKALKGNMTVSTATVLYKPESVLVLHNVMAEAYVSGGGTTLHQGSDLAENARRSRGERTGDILVMPEFPWVDHKEKVLPFSGEFCDSLLGVSSRVKQSRERTTVLAYSSAAIAREVFSADSQGGTSLDNCTTFAEAVALPNDPICWKGNFTCARPGGQGALPDPAGFSRPGYTPWGTSRDYSGVVGDRCGRGQYGYQLNDMQIPGPTPQTI